MGKKIERYLLQTVVIVVSVRDINIMKDYVWRPLLCSAGNKNDDGKNSFFSKITRTMDTRPKTLVYGQKSNTKKPIER